MGRHPRQRNRGRTSPITRRLRPPAEPDPGAALRSLVREGVVTAAALGARDDLRVAAMSMERLGQLTSGMWRALSRELLTAADRLDTQVDERMDDLYRHANALDVTPDAVLAAGVAGSHLDEHRETLESLLATVDEVVRRLAAPQVLLGFSVDDDVLVEDAEFDKGEVDAGGTDDTDAEVEASDGLGRPAIDVWLFLWPAPLSPARVRIVPELSAADAGSEPDVPSVRVGAMADDALLDGISDTCELTREDVQVALSALGMACWSAHQLDESADQDGDDVDEADGIDVDDG